MSTDIPTPDPRPVPEGTEAVYAAAINALSDYETTPYGDLRLNANRAGAKAVTAALEVLDLPARDALIRADERRKIDKEIRRYASECGKPGLALIIEGVAGRVAAADDSPAPALSGPVEGSTHRCPSRIAHESGAVRGCLPHDDRQRLPHGSPDGVRWADDDDRVLVEGSGHPQPATADLVRAEAVVLSERGGMVSAHWVAARLTHIADFNCPGPGPLGKRVCVHNTPTEGDTDANH